MATAAALFLLGSALSVVVFSYAGLGYLAWVLTPGALFAGYLLHRAARHRPGELSKGYTRALVLVGFSLVLFAATLHDPDAFAEDLRRTMILVQRCDVVLAVACLVVAGLRAAGSRFALPATAAVSPLLLFVLPLGTAASIWWMIRVRGTEATARASAA
ncbi:MAG: hypothetical protein ACYS0E_20645 [Planctomycetota bacterium]|jgi:hypothetical protein